MRVPTCPKCGSQMRLEVWRSGPAWRCDFAPLCGEIRQYEGETVNAWRARTTPDILIAQTDFNRLWERAERNYATIGNIWRVVLTVRTKARQRAYTWLALQLNIDAAELHIGMLTTDDCRRAITLCRATSDKAIREWAKNETTGATR